MGRIANSGSAWCAPCLLLCCWATHCPSRPLPTFTHASPFHFHVPLLQVSAELAQVSEKRCLMQQRLALAEETMARARAAQRAAAEAVAAVSAAATPLLEAADVPDAGPEAAAAVAAMAMAVAEASQVSWVGWSAVRLSTGGGAARLCRVPPAALVALHRCPTAPNPVPSAGAGGALFSGSCSGQCRPCRRQQWRGACSGRCKPGRSSSRQQQQQRQRQPRPALPCGGQVGPLQPSHARRRSPARHSKDGRRCCAG